jgi:chromosome segregation ATPase
MNAAGFFMHRLAWQFGFKGERARWSAVTRETQLLAEAQDLLGKMAWDGMENIDEMSGEYWQLRDLSDQQNQMREASDRLIAENEAAQDRLYAIEEKHEQQIEAIQARKSEYMEKAVQVMADVDDIKGQDSETRRKFASLKAKLEVLKKQPDDYASEVEKTRQALLTLKESHSTSLAEIAQREEEVTKLEQSVKRIDEEVASRRDALRAETTELVSDIGRRSKQIAELSAKIGAVDTQKGDISFRIGQFLSHHTASKDPAIRAVLQPYRPIVRRIEQLRASVQYNQRLARRVSR